MRRAAQRARPLLIAACLALGGATPALANELVPTDAHERQSVEVRVAGPAVDVQALEASLGELMRRLDLDLRVSAVETLPEPSWDGLPASTAVVVRVDLRGSDAAIVMLSSPGARATEPRRVPWRASRDLLVEETALVVYTGTESLLEEPPPPAPAPPPTVAEPPPVTPVTRPAPVDARPPPLAAAPTPVPWVVQATLFAELQAFTSNDLAVPGLGVGARTHIGRAAYPGWWLLGGFHFPTKQTDGTIELTSTVWSLRLVPTFQIERSTAWSLELGAGGGIDIFAMTVGLAPGSTVPDAALANDPHNTSALLTAMGAASFGTARTSKLVLMAMLDCDLTPRRYVVVSSGARSTLLESLPIRPALALGFSFDAAGSRGER